MKAKLLKKLKCQYVIQQRNNEFRFFDNKECSGGIFNHSEWYKDIKYVRQIQREFILKRAQNWKTPKKKML